MDVQDFKRLVKRGVSMPNDYSFEVDEERGKAYIIAPALGTIDYSDYEKKYGKRRLLSFMIEDVELGDIYNILWAAMIDYRITSGGLSDKDLTRSLSAFFKEHSHKLAS